MRIAPDLRESSLINSKVVIHSLFTANICLLRNLKKFDGFVIFRVQDIFS